MAIYLSPALFKDTPSLDDKSVGWYDDKGLELKKVAIDGYDHYTADMKTASTYADAFAKKISEVDSFLSRNEPTLKSL